jgi:hypothetical protein
MGTETHCWNTLRLNNWSRSHCWNTPLRNDLGLYSCNNDLTLAQQQKPRLLFEHIVAHHWTRISCLTINYIHCWNTAAKQLPGVATMTEGHCRNALLFNKDLEWHSWNNDLHDMTCKHCWKSVYSKEHIFPVLFEVTLPSRVLNVGTEKKPRTCQNSLSLGRDLNSERPEYKSEVLATRFTTYLNWSFW